MRVLRQQQRNLAELGCVRGSGAVGACPALPGTRWTPACGHVRAELPGPEAGTLLGLSFLLIVWGIQTYSQGWRSPPASCGSVT